MKSFSIPAGTALRQLRAAATTLAAPSLSRSA
jgi:hypothetical protein